ncbi:MAG: manganese efflux pump, partial [Lachnospiraceae bacterium]|nr:manganese efflux pump [Lachnospiraceae bacterium]
PLKIISASAYANLFLGALIITCTTFVFSFCGISIGAKFGSKNRKIAQITGGVILIAIGVKILLEHLGVF